jgi:hypothetical protein
MSCSMVRRALATVALAMLTVPAAAATFFSEDFSGGNANWRFNTATPLTAVASGGVDGGAYVSHTLTLPAAPTASQILFRAQTPFNSSGLAYTGNWQSLGVYEVSAWVRQNTGQPLVLNARVASEFNFPGASYYSAIAPDPANLPSGVWTKLTFDVTPTSPQNVVYETSYGEVFSAVGNLQFGINIPAGLNAGGPFTFDLDRVQILRVPEPAVAGLASLAAAGLAFVRRRNRA